eukprot:Sspe_Gene.110964::Locus_92107_Transcript_1_1_Confidence_1.000_Length_800::g.110964::m.110964
MQGMPALKKRKVDERPRRLTAAIALQRISEEAKGKEEDEDDEEEEEDDDEVFEEEDIEEEDEEDDESDASTVEQHPVVAPTATRLLLSPSDYAKYEGRVQAVAAWRERAAEAAKSWDGASTAYQVWEMPRSGQPLPISQVEEEEAFTFRGEGGKKVSRRVSVMAKAKQKWGELKANLPELDDELRMHRRSSEAYLPRQEFLSQAQRSQSTADSQGYNEHMDLMRLKKKI